LRLKLAPYFIYFTPTLSFLERELRAYGAIISFLALS